MDFQTLFDVSQWFNPLPRTTGLPDIVALGVFLVWTGVNLYVYYFRRRVFAGKGALIGMQTRFGVYPIIIGVTGVFLLVMRFVRMPYFSMSFLLYLTIVSAIGYLVFLAYYFVRRYPAKVAEVQAAEMRRRYAPGKKRNKRRR